MPNRHQLIQMRIIHLCIIFATAIFFYQFSAWDDALWIPISVLALIGPVSSGLSINKAKQRFIGSLTGLLISILIWLVLNYNFNLLIPLALLLIYLLAFSALQKYTYFIMLISVMLCINSDYLNPDFNYELTHMVNRALCLLAGLIICQFYEHFVFRHYYSNALELVETERLDELIIKVWERIKTLSDSQTLLVSELNSSIQPLIESIAKLQELKTSCLHGYSKQTATIELIERYEAKLVSLYDWLNTMGYNLLNNKRQALAHELPKKDLSCND